MHLIVTEIRDVIDNWILYHKDNIHYRVHLVTRVFMGEQIQYGYEVIVEGILNYKR